MKFTDTTADDRRMRQRVLDVMTELDKAVQGRHVVEFEVVRTVNRKGYRHELGFNDTSSYLKVDPKTQIKVVFEVPDDVRPSVTALVADITKIEADGIRAAKEAKIAAARERAAAAQAEVERLERELNEEQEPHDDNTE